MGSIKIAFIRYIKKAFKSLGFVLVSNKNIETIKRQHLNAMKAVMLRSDECSTEAIAGLVFSKDRPMQLYALIRSYFQNVSSPCPLEVLYKASNQEYLNGYLKVQLLCEEYEVNFNKEESFKDDLIRILRRLDVSKIFFLVDDILFTRKMDMKIFLNVDLNEYVPSMRLGSNLKKCYTQNVNQSVPLLNEYSESIKGVTLYTWFWKEGEFDWGYPLSVDGNIFLMREILAMAIVGEYKAPNTFEKSLQWFSDAYKERYGLCAKKSFLVNIPFNKVQGENGNLSGDVSENELLRSWFDGNEIDIDKYYGVDNVSAHQEFPLYLMKRKEF